MKGHYQNPKRVWNHRDLEHQHFTESTGWHFRNKVKKDDLMLIYLPGPGNKAFMGLQKAAFTDLGGPVGVASRNV